MWCSVRSATTPIKIIDCWPKLLPTEFRDHLILGYEILKWEADTLRPNIFHPLDTNVAEEKARLLLKHYPSQMAHDWFDEQAFLGLVQASRRAVSQPARGGLRAGKGKHHFRALRRQDS